VENADLVVGLDVLSKPRISERLTCVQIYGSVDSKKKFLAGFAMLVA
jgi:hypothetical protein